MKKNSKKLNIETPEELDLSTGEILFDLGKSYYSNMNFAKAEKYLLLSEKCLLVDEEENTSNLLHQAYSMLMRMCAERCDSQKHEYYRNVYANFLKKQNGKSQFAKYHYLIGVQNYTSSNLKAAMTAFRKSFDFAKSQKNLQDKAYALYGIASCQLSSQEYENCQRTLHQASQLEHHEDLNLQISIMILKGLTFHKQKKYDQAIKIYNEALKASQTQHNWYLYFSTVHNIAIVYRQKGNRRKAKGFLSNWKLFYRQLSLRD